MQVIRQINKMIEAKHYKPPETIIIYLDKLPEETGADVIERYERANKIIDNDSSKVYVYILS